MPEEHLEIGFMGVGVAKVDWTVVGIKPLVG